MKVGVHIGGTQLLVKNFEARTTRAGMISKRATSKAGTLVKKDMKSRLDYRTGKGSYTSVVRGYSLQGKRTWELTQNLKDSIAVREIPGGISIGPEGAGTDIDEKAAIKLEYGGSGGGRYQPARPFVRPSLTENEKEIQSIFLAETVIAAR